MENSRLQPIMKFSRAKSIKHSTADYVTDELRKAIILRKFALGERLVETEIAGKLGVSITPVRHAFMQLSTEGLVEIFSYRGNYVTTITPEFIADVKVCRNLIELEAASYAYDNFLKEDPCYLMNIISRAEELYNRSSYIYDVLNNDIEFHQSIIEFSKNKILLVMWNAISSRIMLLQSYAKQKEPFNIKRFTENHIEVAEALFNQKGKDAFIDAVRRNLAHTYCEEECEKIMYNSFQTSKDK